MIRYRFASYASYIRLLLFNLGAKVQQKNDICKF